jgi:hypothetical protein
MMSDNLHDMTGRNRTLAEINSAMTDLQHEPKTPHGGGGGGEMLDARVARLESDVGEIKSDIKGLRSEMNGLKVEMAEMKGKLGMLPGWGGLMTITAFIIAAVGLMLRFMPPSAP